MALYTTKLTLKFFGDNIVGTPLFQTTIYNIIGLHCRWQYFNLIKKSSVHLREFQQTGYLTHTYPTQTVLNPILKIIYFILKSKL